MNKYRLGDIAKVEVSGIDKKTKEGEKLVRLCNFVDVYYNWAITKNMYEGLMQASASDSDIETFSLQRGQVAITKDSETRDDIGVATYIADDFDDVVLGYHCALITPKDDVPEEQRIYGKYLNAILHTKYAQKYFSNNATGSGQRYTLSKEAIEDMPIYLPLPQEQKRIGDYLSDIDNKIELNNLINAELEAIAKQIYDYWFVQFDFPNNEGNPYKSSGGKMVWNEAIKKEVPEGWEVDYLSHKIGGKKSGDWGQDDPSDLNSLKVNCIRGADFSDPTNAPVRFISNKNEKRLLEEDDIIIEISGGSPIQATGRSVFVSKGLAENYNGNLTCSNFCQAITFENKYMASFFYFTWNLLYDNGNMFNYEGKTSGIKNLQIDTLLENLWYFPPQELLIEFSTIYSDLLLMRDKNIKANNELHSLRNSVTPLLVYGQVTIKE